MINHVIETVGMIFSKIDPIKRIPSTLSTQLYIDYNIENISGNVITTSELLDTSLILLYENIGGYSQNSIFVTETFKIFPSVSNKKYNYNPNMHRYILIPDIIKDINTGVEETTFIIYNVISELIKSIRYIDKRTEYTLTTIPLILTTYILYEYGIVSSKSDILNILTGYEIGSDSLVEITDLINNCYSNIPEILSANIDIFDNKDIKIRTEETCKIISL